ncbi:hypothetical protein MJO28_004521 [Puccinia striiformis f. sp. tritici]|uniref:Uncharacterized protein n=1 Tax=Puccinia striiformis f. sp. tritici TaxID=168172 RepID=A0ACC0EPT9_9BASI|nr:hypothetical protein MJO28_004521 [Puccinia striiformis f. sp. tritici]
MSTAMNLPDAVFGSIIRQIELRIQDECGEESALNRTFYSNEIDCLRLVGREWQAWLSERPYHRKLSITVPWRLVLLPKPPSCDRAICQYSFKVDNLLICRIEDGIVLWNVDLDWLDHLMKLCSDTIAELEIGVFNYFTLPTAMIERMGGMRNLRTLRIRFMFWGRGRRQIRAGLFNDHPPNDLLNDSDCLRKLLSVNTGLETVDLTDFRPRSPLSLRTLRSGDDGFSSITALYLDHKICANLSQVALGSLLSSKLPNIKLLSIQGAGHDGRELLPVFESLRRSLEELFVFTARVLEPMLHLRFPKLRFLRIYSWPNCSLSCFVCEPMFSQAPLEVIALRLRKTEDSCLSPRFISLPHLRQLVICGPGIESLSFSWEYYLKRASTHGVECVRLPDGNQIFQRMSDI